MGIKSQFRVYEVWKRVDKKWKFRGTEKDLSAKKPGLKFRPRFNRSSVGSRR